MLGSGALLDPRELSDLNGFLTSMIAENGFPINNLTWPTHDGPHLLQTPSPQQNAQQLMSQQNMSQLSMQQFMPQQSMHQFIPQQNIQQMISQDMQQLMEQNMQQLLQHTMQQSLSQNTEQSMPQSTQQYMNNILSTAGNNFNINGLNGNTSPHLNDFAMALSPSSPQARPQPLPQRQLVRPSVRQQLRQSLPHAQPQPPSSESNSPNHASPSQVVKINPFDGHGLGRTKTEEAEQEEAALNLAWGSDPSFRSSGFHAPVQSPTQQDVERQVLAAMIVHPSSENTAANSPAENKYEDIIGSDAGSNFTTGNAQSPTLSATQPSGIKRRAEDDDNDQQGQARKSRQRKDSSTEPAPKGKRGGKREQLTEAEKRANHIQSEQKRRNQIKTGFDTLTDIVPELKGGGYSKSAVLQHAAVFVQNLVGGNERLREMLRGLEERNANSTTATAVASSSSSSSSGSSSSMTMNGNGYP